MGAVACSPAGGEAASAGDGPGVPWAAVGTLPAGGGALPSSPAAWGMTVPAFMPGGDATGVPGGISGPPAEGAVGTRSAPA
ncbi:protein of unknown function [Rhodovastum atsumiense]|nr:protein of unknown function [Rhodovastum atsumiense]